MSDLDSLSRIKVAAAIIDLEVKKGHLKWSVLTVAKASEMSRSLVYYQFGKTKKDILFNSLSELLEEFYGLSQTRREMSLLQSLRLTHEIYRRNPSLAVFFQKWRNTDSEIATMLKESERKYEAKLSLSFTKASPAQVRSLHAIFHGFVTAPYLDATTIEVALRLIRIDGLR